MKSVAFRVYGTIKGKGRARTVRNKYTGKTMSFTPNDTKSYEDCVRAAYLEKAKGVTFDKEPVAIEIRCYFIIPKSMTKLRRQMAIDKAVFPTKKPDLDNVMKIVCDALNKIAYYDDSQVVFSTVGKVYSDKDMEYIEVVVHGV